MARSLMEGIDKGAAPAAKRGSKSGDGGKLLLAVALFLVAGAVFAWYQGWIFSGGPKGTQLSPEETAQQQKEFTEQQKATEQRLKTGQQKIGGTS